MITENRKRARLPQAPRTPLPELAEFLAPLRVHFTQGPSAETLGQYLTGLLSEHPNKNCDTLAAVVPETNEQQFNHLLTDIVWDESALNRQRIVRMQTLPSEGDGVLIFDDTGFEKRGRHSVGVARQYTGTADKVTNCQVTVNCHYAERTLAWPVATRLYLPQEWATEQSGARRVPSQPTGVQHPPHPAQAVSGKPPHRHSHRAQRPAAGCWSTAPDHHFLAGSLARPGVQSLQQFRFHSRACLKETADGRHRVGGPPVRLPPPLHTAVTTRRACRGRAASANPVVPRRARSLPLQS
jgi:hypothetical protein